MTQSTEQERADFEAWWSSPSVWSHGHKEAQWAAWQAARRAPAVPDGFALVPKSQLDAWQSQIRAAFNSAPEVPQFNPVAQKKLGYLLEAGETITGYAIENKDGRRGAIDCHGFVYWWLDAAAPQPPDVLIRENPTTKTDAKNNCANLDQLSKNNDLAAPVQLPEPVAAESRFTSFSGDRWKWCTVEHARAFGQDKGYEVRYLYTEQQVRQILSTLQK